MVPPFTSTLQIHLYIFGVTLILVDLVDVNCSIFMKKDMKRLMILHNFWTKIKENSLCVLLPQKQSDARPNISAQGNMPGLIWLYPTLIDVFECTIGQ